jgi:hypothetical protein
LDLFPHSTSCLRGKQVEKLFGETEAEGHPARCGLGETLSCLTLFHL